VVGRHDDDFYGEYDAFGEYDEPTEDDFFDDEDEDDEPLRPVQRFEQSAVGSVVAASMFGLRDVLEPSKKEEVQIVTDWSGDPPFTDPYVLRLDPDNPEDSIVMVRPWLRDGPHDAADAAGATQDDDEK
jgi:hypothetical protein